MRPTVLAVPILVACGGGPGTSGPTDTGASDSGGREETAVTDPTGAPDPNQALVDQLEESRLAWEGRLAANGEDYTWTRREAAYSGVIATTTVVVEGGAVVERSFVRECGSASYPGCDEAWTERGAELGSHDPGMAEPAITVSEVYDRCRSEVLTRDPEVDELTLRFHPDGLLALCEWFPRDCADDCAGGYGISTVAW